MQKGKEMHRVAVVRLNNKNTFPSTQFILVHFKNSYFAYMTKYGNLLHIIDSLEEFKSTSICVLFYQSHFHHLITTDRYLEQ